MSGESEEVHKALDELIAGVSVEEAIERIEGILDYAEAILAGLKEDLRREQE